ncbi:MAG: enoyl-CoA hydratase [Deltaproteobacteria bacterium HGW-Deltaproteobacteria-12]|jgi:enoyl-CoA hydratase|nr:MAG: enoyl-CoA hydratase [Deltaproteobacteria bacterium HGW-Deltaproteobacteria-12]
MVQSKDPFRVEREGHIAWLILDRPEKRNAMGFDFYKGLAEHFAAFDEDPEIRVVVMRAEGKSFTTGTDLTELGSLYSQMDAGTREKLRLMILKAQNGMNQIEKCRKPVIAAVHSHCLGGGVDLLSACDIRIATQDAVFGVREVRVAFIADVGTLQRLPHIIGHGWFRELALTGRDFGADEALKIGFITRICTDREALIAEARKLAQEIAACSPLAVQGTKDVIIYSRDKGIHPGLEYVAQKNAAAIPSDDMIEAAVAFMEKRAPVFKGK